MEKIPIKVLYVEDEDFIRIPMTELLMRRIQQLETASNGDEAIEIARLFRPELLMTDIKMQGISGLELIRTIRQFLPNIRTMILSAHNEANFFIDAIELGVDSFLIKPVNRQNLFKTIERLGEETIQRKRAAISELKFKTLTSAANDSIIILDQELLITFSNEATDSIFGYPNDALINRPIHILFPDFSLPDSFQQTGNTTFSGAKPIELEARRKDATTFICENSCSIIELLEKPGILLIIRDITERKKREEELMRAKEDAEAATKAKQQFLSVMSHEIRTPLNGILGTVHLLAQEDPRADQLDYLNTLEFSGNQLMSIVNDILDFSKIEATGIQFEKIEFNLKEQINGLIKIFTFKAADKGIDLSLDFGRELPEVVAGDSMRLNQILTNLIGNALKFTEKGEIRVKVSLAKEDTPTFIQFSVTDTGIGIEEQKLETIFEFFSQADANTTRKYGGTGLGLAITRKLVELQGGYLRVRSKVGTGSVFSFELPFDTTDLQHEHTIVKADGNKLFSLAGINVLLVEDNKINQMIANKFLDRWKCTTDVASNGFQALSMIVKKKYNIVLMDLQMPDLDGYETSIRIRKMDDDYYRNIPIVALTASAFNEVKEGVMRAGMTDILNKPFIPDELNQKIYFYTRQ
ncbi:MAG TPA: hypothetical protein DEO70_13170 [Bacteroidales bacterium]|nr:MAG: hypothetical protein A2X11_06100 [Bacteroidetes bacterium GWE2_42_24]OFY31352.1 MAG: hypothetical protein A2X09_01180 [Bacteroidetes bacterium GWF2_43_11]HBZ67778.1 hypothetical protein [Bacteroidales bacterium]